MTRMPKRVGGRTPRIGPGTLLALAVCGVAVALGRATRRPHFPGERVWRGQAAPHASSPVALQPSPPPLVKPDPGYILDRADELKLAPGQRTALAALDARWRKQKERLISAMEAAADPARAGRAGSVERLAADLAGYSALSREFEVLRRRAWEDARRALSPDQARQIDAMLSRGSAK